MKDNASFNHNNSHLEECLEDLYRLGIIQGEHNINWTDEYQLLEHSMKYYEKTKSIADKYDIKYSNCLEDYRDDEDDEEYLLWDRLAFTVNEMTRNHIHKIIKGTVS